MKYILIIVISGAWGVAIDTAEFNDKAACQDAGRQVAQQSTIAGQTEIKYGCAKKSTGQPI